MKNKIVFKKRLSLVFTIVCLITFVLEVYVAYFVLFTDAYDEDRKLPMTVFIIASMVVTPLCWFCLMFRQYLKVNEEMVTLCKWFKCEKIINWKDATITNSFKQNMQQTVTITDGTKTIQFDDVSDKTLQLFNHLCKTARDKCNTDKLTI